MQVAQSNKMFPEQKVAIHKVQLPARSSPQCLPLKTAEPNDSFLEDFFLTLYDKGSYFSLISFLKKGGKGRFSRLKTILFVLNILVFLLLWKIYLHLNRLWDNLNTTQLISRKLEHLTSIQQLPETLSALGKLPWRQLCSSVSIWAEIILI